MCIKKLQMPHILQSGLSAVDTNGDGNFQPPACRAGGKVDERKDHYEYSGRPVCPDSEAVAYVMNELGLSKLWGNMDELEILITGAYKLQAWGIVDKAIGIGMLSDLKDEQAKALIRKTFQSTSDAYVRDSAVGAMARSGDESAIPLILKALQTDPDERVRKDAADFFLNAELGKGEEKITIALADALRNDTDDRVRYNAARALAFRRKDAVAAQILLDAVETEDDAGVRNEIFMDLGHCVRDPIAMPALVLHSSEYEEDGWSRHGAQYGLNMLLDDPFNIRP